MTPEQEIASLLGDAPLAWIVSGGSTPMTSLIPLFIRPEPHGPSTLRGHFARSNPHMEVLRADGHASVLVLGPNGYISPSWLSDRTQAPSWNYAAARIEARFHLHDDPQGTVDLLCEQCAFFERGRRRAWSPPEMGARLERLAAAVIGFEAEVLEIRPMFKLGQSDREDVYAQSLAALDTGANPELAEWMRAHNRGRGTP